MALFSASKAIAFNATIFLTLVPFFLDIFSEISVLLGVLFSAIALAFIILLVLRSLLDKSNGIGFIMQIIKGGIIVGVNLNAMLLKVIMKFFKKTLFPEILVYLYVYRISCKSDYKFLEILFFFKIWLLNMEFKINAEL